MKWGRGGMLRYNGYEFYFEYDPKLYYPACVKKADAEFLKEQNDYQEEQRRLKRESERLKRWKQLETKWKAEEEFFFIKHDKVEISQEKLKDIVEEIVIHDEGLIVDEEVQITETIEDEQSSEFVITEEEILEELLEKKECKEFLLGEAKEDVMTLNSCTGFVKSSLQVHDKENTGLLDSTHAAPKLPWDDILPIGNGEKPPHNFHDPFTVYVDATMNCYDYISDTPVFIDIHIKPRYTLHIVVMKQGSRHQHAILKLCIRLIFDPGVYLVIFWIHSSLAHASELYDILLIRGRILHNREGMM